MTDGVRQTTVDWQREDYGLVNFGDGEGPLGLQGAGMGNPLAAVDRRAPQSPTNEDYERRIRYLEEQVRKLWLAVRQLQKGIGTITVTDDLLLADTETGDLDEWVDLTGLSRVLALNRPATVFVVATVRVRCQALSSVSGAQVAVRLIVNDDREIGRTVWSHTDNDLSLPGRSEEAIIPITVTGVFDGNKDRDYTIETEIANLGTELAFTAEQSEVDASRMTALVLPRRQDKVSQPAIKNPEHSRYVWFSVSYTSYGSGGGFVIARARGVWRQKSQVGTGVPDYTYFEVAKVYTSELPQEVTDLPVGGGGHVFIRFGMTNETEWPNVQFANGNGLGYQAPNGRFFCGTVYNFRVYSPAGYLIEQLEQSGFDDEDPQRQIQPMEIGQNGDNLYVIEPLLDPATLPNCQVRMVRRNAKTLAKIAEDTVDLSGLSGLDTDEGVHVVGFIDKNTLGNVLLYVTAKVSNTWHLYRVEYDRGTDTWGSPDRVLASHNLNATRPARESNGNGVLKVGDDFHVLLADTQDGTIGYTVGVFDGEADDFDEMYNLTNLYDTQSHHGCRSYPGFFTDGEDLYQAIGPDFGDPDNLPATTIEQLETEEIE